MKQRSILLLLLIAALSGGVIYWWLRKRKKSLAASAAAPCSAGVLKEFGTSYPVLDIDSAMCNTYHLNLGHCCPPGQVYEYDASVGPYGGCRCTTKKLDRSACDSPVVCQSNSCAWKGASRIETICCPDGSDFCCGHHYCKNFREKGESCYCSGQCKKGLECNNVWGCLKKGVCDYPS